LDFIGPRLGFHAKSVQSFQTRASWCNQAKTNFDQKHD
jgi:hypothetical protein